MTIEHKYPIQIVQWKHETFEKFFGKNEEKLEYGLNLSQIDIFNRCLYFHVKILHKHYNDCNGIVFSTETVSSFRLKYEPTLIKAEPLFELIHQAGYEYAKIFHHKTQNTNLYHHKISRPSFKEFSPELNSIVDDWNSKHHFPFVHKRKIIIDFPGLPNIPLHKRYDETKMTLEQRISYKLFKGQRISEEEEQIFSNLPSFYNELNNSLLNLDYSSFKQVDIDDFKAYLSYAFNYTPLITNQIEVNRLYRLVINESVSGKNVRIVDTKYMKYPNLQIVTEKNVFNRCSTSKSTLFYLTEDIDTAIRETKPPINRLVTVGAWKPKKGKKFTSYPIIYDEKAIAANPNIQEAYASVKEIEDSYNPLLSGYLRSYLKLLCREYSKPIKSKLEYLISALFSESILELESDNTDFNFDCILYPSVGNKFKTINIAFKPNVADQDFFLEKVIEFEIESYSDHYVSKTDPEEISVARVCNLAVTNRIQTTGEILW
ncbi:hypothetical protein [Olivibacter jilunii]|uniref:hypothetical protein n=1 Tax=Olivibacter jilunii TaxID=985016 RepID=UPI00103225CC|nr:hypothetical protein [Olivibacter jilunii]